MTWRNRDCPKGHITCRSVNYCAECRSPHKMISDPANSVRGRHETAQTNISDSAPDPLTSAGQDEALTRLKSKRTIVTGVIVAVAILVILGSFFDTSMLLRSSTPSSKSSVGDVILASVSVIEASVPVIKCPTTVGVSMTPHPYPAKSKSVKVPSSLAHKLSFYTDSYGQVQPLLGPSGWKCTAVVGADGTYGITLFPHNGSHGERIEADSDGPCLSCVSQDACPWLNKTLRKWYDTVPSLCLFAGQVSHIISIMPDTSAAIVQVTDPPGVLGSLTPTRPSQTLATHGYVVYNMKNQWAVTLACTLPASEQDICSVIESNFISSKWGYLGNFA